jgi:diaminopimelate epimerase
MCGNGLRCALRHWARQGVIEIGQAVAVSTGAGPRIGQVDASGAIHLWMGVPGFQRSQIPTTGPGGEEFRAQTLAIDTQEITVSALSMGNPHLVAFVDDIASIPLSAWGPALEHSPFFPERINVEFAQVQSPGEVSMRVWERGAGLTRACGTGACAVAVTGIREGSLQSPVTVHMPGGSVQVEWSEGSEVRLSGPAVHVFAGEFDIADFHPPS